MTGALRREALATAVVWIVVAGIVAGSLLPRSSSAFAPVRTVSDALLHAGSYAVLTGLRAMYDTWARRRRTVLFCLALGVTLELLQPLVGRTFAIGDILANIAGLVLGFLIAALTRFTTRTPARP